MYVVFSGKKRKHDDGLKDLLLILKDSEERAAEREERVAEREARMRERELELEIRQREREDRREERMASMFSSTIERMTYFNSPMDPPAPFQSYSHTFPPNNSNFFSQPPSDSTHSSSP